MADEKQIYRLDLDTKEFTEKANRALDILEKMGDGGALDGLVAGLGSAARVAGVVGTAFLAMKAALNLTESAEEIRAINAQFELLSRNAGIAGDALKDGLVKAAGGLADDTDLIKAANKAIIQMGDSAAKLPEVMSLARRATEAFGGDLVQNFEALNQAIASGQTRALKQYGIIVDQKKAYEDYARSIGVAVSTLSEHGKQQAMLNAVLESGGKSLKGVSTDLREATNLTKQIRVTLGQLGEAATLAFEKVMGPAVKGWLILIQKASEATTDFFNRNFGEGADKARAQLKDIGSDMGDLAKKIIAAKQQLEQNKADGGGFFGGGSERAIQEQQKYIDSLTRQYEELRTKRNAALKELPQEAAPAAGKTGGTDDSGPTDPEAALKQALAFEQSILKIKQDRNAQERQLITDLSQVEDIERNAKLLKEQAFQDQIAQIRSNADMTDAQKAEEIKQLQLNHNNELKIAEQELYDKRAQLYDAYQKKAMSVGDGITRAFHANGLKNKKELTDFGSVGQATFDTFSSHATAAFMSMGEGTKSASEIMKGFFFGMLSDMAAKYGAFMLLASVYPPNPPGLAAGAGLLILAGALRGLAGGKADAGGAGVSASAGAGAVLSSRSEAINSELNVAENAKDEDKIKELKMEQIQLEKDMFEQKKKETFEDKDLNNEQKNQIVADLQRIYDANVTRIYQELNESVAGLKQASLDLAGNVGEHEVSRRAVTVQVQGHYFETEQTKTKLMEMVRDATDATDFKYVQVGQR